MEAIRQEIREELKSLRIDKKHVYGLLMRLVDEIDSAPAPAPAPATAPAQTEEAPKPVKKVVRRTKKKVEDGEPVLK